jgi:hypothetical protein
MYIGQDGELYDGDMRHGDRLATAQEIAEWEVLRGKQIAKSLIKTREQQDALARPVREALLAMAEKEAQDVATLLSTPQAPVTAADVLAANDGYMAVKAFDQEMIALRSPL